MNKKFYKIRVLRSGLMTTIQDLGIKNSQHLGVTTGGAIDNFSYQLGNMILNNISNTPSIEFAKVGPKLLIEKGNINLVLTGNINFKLTINNSILNGEVNKTYFMRKGDSIDILNTLESNYGYISIKNGILTTKFNDSSSTLISSNIGGNYGKKITNNQIIEGISSEKELNLKINNLKRPNDKIVRVINGSHMNYFKIKDIKKFFEADFIISENINRIGLRLINNPIKPLKSYNIDSEGIIKGTIQIPGDGNPIILASDHPTIGGYPKFATVVMADFDKIFQMTPNTKFRFNQITIEEAEKLLIDYKNRINNIKKLIVKF